MIILLIVLVGTVMRFSVITLRPFHHDEAVLNEYFVNMLILRGGTYQYDSNYHGPLMFYVTVLIFRLFGDSVFTARVIQASLSATLVLLYFLFVKKFTKYKLSSLLATAYVAISPILIYYGNFAFHDAYFLFFWALSLIFLLRFFETNKKIHFMIFVLFSSLLFCIKEISYIVVSLELLGFLFLYYEKNKKKNVLKLYWNAFKGNVDFLIENLIIFIGVIFTFYSNFFRDVKWTPIRFFYKSLASSFNLSSNNQAKPFSYYTSYIMLHTEPVVFYIFVFYSAFYLSYYFIKRFNHKVDFKEDVKLFIVVLAVSMYLILSKISYKTNWNVVYFYLPMLFVLPLFFDFTLEYLKEISVRNSKRIKVMSYIGIMSVVILLFANGVFSYYISNVRYPTESKYNHLSYVQTSMDYPKMMKIIKTENKTLGKNFNVVFLNDDNWPGYWFFRRYKNVNFYTSVNQFLEYNSIRNKNYNSSIYIIRNSLLNKFKQKVNNLTDYKNYSFNLRDQGDVRVTLFIRNNK